MEPEGLYYIPNYITDSEANEIINFLKQEEWKPVGTSKNSRKVLHYGYIYSYDRSGTKKTKDIPDSLKSLIEPERIKKLLDVDISSLDMNQLIVNEYLPGQGIADHIDHTKQFGDVIVCISLGSDVQIDFTGEGRVISHLIAKNSLYIMKGKARYEYTHGIKPRKSDNKIPRNTRFSLTYRTVI